MPQRKHTQEHRRPQVRVHEKASDGAARRLQTTSGHIRFHADLNTHPIYGVYFRSESHGNRLIDFAFERQGLDFTIQCSVDTISVTLVFLVLTGSSSLKLLGIFSLTFSIRLVDLCNGLNILN